MGAEHREQVTVTVPVLLSSPTNYSKWDATNAGSESSRDLGPRVYIISYHACPQ